MRQKHQSIPPVCTITRDQTLKLGMFPDWDRTCNILMYKTMLQPTEPPGQGHCSFVRKKSQLLLITSFLILFIHWEFQLNVSSTNYIIFYIFVFMPLYALFLTPSSELLHITNTPFIFVCSVFNFIHCEFNFAYYIFHI